MKIQIDDEVMQLATKCSKGFRCLSGMEGHLCKIVLHMHDGMNFVRCKEERECPYLEIHNRTAICNCPVREEIYRLYKI